MFFGRLFSIQYSNLFWASQDFVHGFGDNGGTAGDLERRGFSPWGHLDPTRKQSNITFAETLLRDKPQVVGVQIGINDFMHVDPFASNASTIGIGSKTIVLRQKLCSDRGVS